jgi:hypothetical protein
MSPTATSQDRADRHGDENMHRKGQSFFHRSFSIVNILLLGSKRNEKSGLTLAKRRTQIPRFARDGNN